VFVVKVTSFAVATSHQRHTGEDKAILAHRHQLNQAARAAHPERWSGDTPNWEPVTTVSLNPEHKMTSEAVQGVV